MPSPSRGEVWLVNLNPTRSQEIRKTRPVIVVSSDLFSRISLRIAIPVTSWQEKFRVGGASQNGNRPFMIEIAADSQTGLNQVSAGNVLQIRSLSTERFIKRLGAVTPAVLDELLATLAVCTDYS